MSQSLKTLHDIKWQCGCHSESLADSYINLSYKYWLSKSTILSDPSNLLKPIFKMLNFKTMQYGLTNVVLDYGFGLTISKPYNVWYDKNDLPIACFAFIKKFGFNRGAEKQIRIVDWKLFDERYTNPLLKEEILISIGWGNYKNVYNKKNKIVYDKNNKIKKEFVLNNDVFKGIFLKNDLLEYPLLNSINKIIKNIHDLDWKSDINRETINVNYSIKTNTKLDKNQIDNFSVEVACDGRGILLNSSENDNSDNSSNNFVGKTELINNSLNRWSEIQQEFVFWDEAFYSFNGISKEKISEQRENLPETQARLIKLSAIEAEHFEPRQNFIDEYNSYLKTTIDYKGDVIIDFDSVVKNVENTDIVIEN